MPQGVGVQVPPSALDSQKPLPCRLMVGLQPLELAIVVRIHAGQHFFNPKVKQTQSAVNLPADRQV